jgi:Protein of unknown function (DUF4241)
MARLDNRPNPPVPQPAAAAVRVTIREEPATIWEMALRPGEDIADLAPGEFYGFPVDPGTGAFLDESAAARWSRRLERREWERYSEGAEIDAAIARGKAINVVVDQSTDLNLVIFSCRLGDGTHPVWIGRTGSGEPAAYVADLELLSRNATPISD